jgi:hypothetical protein
MWNLTPAASRELHMSSTTGRGQESRAFMNGRDSETSGWCRITWRDDRAEFIRPLARKAANHDLHRDIYPCTQGWSRGGKLDPCKSEATPEHGVPFCPVVQRLEIEDLKILFDSGGAQRLLWRTKACQAVLLGNQWSLFQSKS